MRVAVVVLGDLARSPRMVSHARELAARDVQVDLIGSGESLPQQLRDHLRITTHLIPDPPPSSRSWLASSAWRGLVLGWRLFARLLALPKPQLILVQTPPAVPTLAVAILAARLRSARLVIDWHNLTSSLVALRLGERHVAVRAVSLHERWCGRLAAEHFAVSRALQRELESHGLTRVHTVPDRPGDAFRPQKASTRAELLTSIFGVPHARLVAVPSSWSLDDDFELLLGALDQCEALIDQRPASAAPFPSIALVLTGDGPRRAELAPRFEGRPARHIRTRAVWLSAGDYPRLIGSADLGISVHRSSSGIDLPIKICDLFGSGVPVCALNYGPCLAELVDDGQNGVMFSTASDLAQLLCELLDDAPASVARLQRLRDGAVTSAAVRWRQGWTTDAWPVLAGAMPA